ncbi:hypothetical protein GLU60_00720 [Nanohaloarchaea archaeon H01]|nr:hypothetical protein [Nanohaloarchaea archaeon H01]
MKILDWFFGDKTDRNQTHEKYLEARDLVEEIDSEIGVENIQEFSRTADLEEFQSQSSRYFRSSKRDIAEIFDKNTTTDDIRGYSEAGLLDSAEYEGVFEAYTLTELGIEVLERDIDNLTTANEVVAVGEEVAENIGEADNALMNQKSRGEITSGNPRKDYVVKQMMDNGASEKVLTDKGKTLNQKFKSLDVQKLGEILSYNQEHEPSQAERLRLLHQNIPHIKDDKRRNKLILDVLKDTRQELNSYQELGSKESIHSLEDDIAEAINVLEVYADVVEDGNELSKEVDSYVAGLNLFHSALDNNYGRETSRQETRLEHTLNFRDKVVEAYEDILY